MIIFRVLDDVTPQRMKNLYSKNYECQPEYHRDNDKKCSCNKPNVPTIVKVTFNGPATVVKWSDGTVTKAVCHKDDKCDYQTGLALAISKKYLKLSGVKSFDKFYNKYTEDKNNHVIKNKAVKE